MAKYIIYVSVYMLSIHYHTVISRKMKQPGKRNEGKRVETRKDECNFETRLIEKVIKVNSEFLKSFYVHWFFV